MRKLNRNIAIQLLACTLLLVIGAQSQENIRFTQGDVNDSATLSLNVPLMSYKGRGIDLPVSLSYSSSVWSMEHLAKVQDSESRTQSITEAIFAKQSKSGWRSALDLPVVEFPKFNDTFSYAGKPSTVTYTGGGCYGYRIAKVIIHMPDGSSHELRKSDTPHLLGYVETSGTFYAVDGSRMRYDGVDADTGTIYMPDGTRYILDAGDAQIIDRHGNTLDYNPSTRTWTDTLGRQIANPLPANPEADTYEYTLPGLAGVNGGEQTYSFKWEALQDALTNPNDDLQYMAEHYLEKPDQLPTNYGDSNYPQEQSGAGFLFHSAHVFDIGEQTSSEIPTLVVGRNQEGSQLFNPIVLTEITLPDGSKYKFSYNVYGEIDKVVYPTNAYEQYEFESPEAEQTGGPPYYDEIGSKEPYVQTERRMKSRQVNANDGTASVEWTYESTYPSLTKIIAPDGTSTEVYKYIPSDYPAVKWGYTDSRKGMVIEKKAFSTSDAIMRRDMSEYEQSTNSFNVTGTCNSSNFSTPAVAMRNPRITKNVGILFEGPNSALAQTNAFTYDTTYEYSTGLDQTLANTYHFTVLSHSDGENETIGNISTGSLAKTTQTIFSANSTYRTTKNILGLPIVVKIKNGSGNVVSQSQMSYDDSGYSPANDRALPTTMRTWDSTKGADPDEPNYHLVTRATFDTYGNRTVATDAKGYATTTTYDSTYHAFPISVTSPVPDDSGTRGSSTPFTTSTSFDTVTGLVLTTTDINGEVTEYEYIDDLLRPTKVTAPNGHETTTEYGAGTSESTRWVKVRSQIDENFWSEAVSKYDGLGRTYKTEKTDAQGNVFTETEYDVMGRVEKSSNPYKTGETKKWTVPEYDDLSRTEKITSPDSGEVQITYALSTTGTIGTTKTITDQAGKTRMGITDALGNMIRVYEGPVNDNLYTDYIFDTLGNLRKTTQGDQIRYFNYDSLGRVLRAKQVEQSVNSSLALASADPITGNNSWTVGYTYDDNSNIATTTDARDITITATYDRLNRLTDRDYEDSTPDVDFYYDGTGLGGVPDNSKGKTSRVYSTVSENKYTEFDEMGRITASQQLTGGQTYAFEYLYNLSGALIEQTYPSGRVVKNTLNADGELQQVQSKKSAASGYWTYADAFSYNAAGAVTKMQLGNGRWETAVYDDERLQVKQIGLGQTDSTQDLLKLEFEYEGPNPSSTPDKNNGSMRKQKITVPNVGESSNGFTATQTYTYDSLNRIADATETIEGVSGNTWKQTFDYDRYGNRRFNTTGSNTTTLGSCSAAVCNPTISASTNRISQSGYTYDANGNLTVDGNSNEYFYDAENHQTKVEDSGNDTLGEYFYDGDGRRIKKIGKAPNGEDELTVFVYDAAGQLAAEYSTQIETEAPKVSYLTTDHLGSPRIATNAAGGVISRKDFTAFGEEVVTAQRTSGDEGNGYDTPNVRQDYTGYQKDLESGLEFAQARYYNTRHGRFTGADPLPASATIKNPQTFNRYSYVINSPYKFVDPLGLALQDIGVEQTNDPYHARWLENHSVYLQQKSVERPPTRESAPTTQNGQEDDDKKKKEKKEEKELKKLTISIRDENNLLDKDNLAAMKAELTAIFAEIEIEVVFSTEKADYTLYVVQDRAGHSQSAGAVGTTKYQTVDGKVQVANSGHVFINQLKESVKRTSEGVARFGQDTKALGKGLGRAGAHEISHYLLQQIAHTASGVMHASFTGDQWFTRNTRGLWHFSTSERTLIRSKLPKK